MPRGEPINRDFSNEHFNEDKNLLPLGRALIAIANNYDLVRETAKKIDVVGVAPKTLSPYFCSLVGTERKTKITNTLTYANEHYVAGLLLSDIDAKIYKSPKVKYFQNVCQVFDQSLQEAKDGKTNSNLINSEFGATSLVAKKLGVLQQHLAFVSYIMMRELILSNNYNDRLCQAVEAVGNRKLSALDNGLRLGRSKEAATRLKIMADQLANIQNVDDYKNQYFNQKLPNLWQNEIFIKCLPIFKEMYSDCENQYTAIDLSLLQQLKEGKKITAIMVDGASGLGGNAIKILKNLLIYGAPNGSGRRSPKS